ncbi:hypothetical protein CMMCAS05_06225 [Clavibacter michiganensis subsp. michiganensis]|nr:hypothetical protein CMMCAS04_10860 [Clavibacter michiganensis subsp. michiganensis]OUD93223.1 hypothetical protein CMMCAS05_06225 [Clavibacter michiganensis subsp. michiganensis]
MPPTTSGTTQGDSPSDGQDSSTSAGAAACPSVARIRLTSSGRRVLSDTSPWPVCSESQRSDPRGSVTVEVAAAAVPDASVPEAPAVGLGVGVGLVASGCTTWLVSAPWSSMAMRVYGLLPTHASTSVVGP